MYDLFQSYGLTHRTRHSIVAKFWHFEQQLNKAERLLREEGLTHFDVNGETQRAVLKMCPYYHQLAPALRPSWLLRPQHYSSSGGDMESDAQSESTDDGEEETWGSSSVQCAAPASPSPKNGRTHPQKIEYAYNTAVAIRWDSDAADGRPSSLDVLLEWLVVPGNAERWCVASGKHDGSQSTLACEVYDLLLVHGITYRSRRSVVRKLRWWEEQFDKAESLLRKSGIQHFDDSAEAKRMVLHICPAYPQIAPVLRSARQSVDTASSRPSRRTSKDARYWEAAHKSATARTKRARSLSPQREDAVDARGAVVLNAETEERREFFKLELQVKRDQAICARAKAGPGHLRQSESAKGALRLGHVPRGC